MQSSRLIGPFPLPMLFMVGHPCPGRSSRQLLRPAKPGRLGGRGRVVRRGRDLAFMSGELVDESGERGSCNRHRDDSKAPIVGLTRNLGTRAPSSISDTSGCLWPRVLNRVRFAATRVNARVHPHEKGCPCTRRSLLGLTDRRQRIER